MYDFTQLSPADFEDLARDLLQEQWKITLETFKSGRDQGIDLRYAGISGKAIIIQCKHFAKSNVSKLVHHLHSEETPKVRRLNPERYVLITSLPLNPADKEQIKNIVSPYIKNTEDILGANDLVNLIGKFPQIEQKHFKLWMSSTVVMQHVLNNAEHVQTDFDVKRIRRAIPLYVQTPNYTRALKIINEHRFVILSGVPGIGKTTLADMLLFAHLESGYQPVIIKSEISEGKKLFNDERPQIFYFDDFLGQTFLGNRFDFLGKKEDSALLDFMYLISRSKHSRLILTTREHVLQHAFQISEHFRREKGGLADHRCILQLSDYTLLDRGRILYNHIYFSDLPWPYKHELLKHDFYLEIVKHRNFNPRLVEWLSRFTNIKALPSAGYAEEVKRVLENPEQLWRIAFEQQISEAARSILLALYSLGGSSSLYKLENVWKLLHRHRAKKYNWKTAPEDWRQSLQDLEGGFLRFDSGTAAFVNPSVKDFFDVTLTSDMEHLEDLLSSASQFEQIVNIWDLAKSEKGKSLQNRLGELKEQLILAINENLQRPYEERIDAGSQGHGIRATDVGPEVRLSTMVSIAQLSHSDPALEAAALYVKEVIEFWEKRRVDFEVGIAILRSLDAIQTNRKRALAIHSKVKQALLNELRENGESSDFFAVVGYAGAKDSTWDESDHMALQKSFDEYLETRFAQEISDFSTEPELEGLAQNIEATALWCKRNVYSYLDEIYGRISELDQPDYEETPVHDWDPSSGHMPEYLQEAEIKRIFEGLSNVNN